jgi:hypothetical protein
MGHPDKRQCGTVLGGLPNKKEAKSKAPPSQTEGGAPKLGLGFIVRATRPRESPQVSRLKITALAIRPSFHRRAS